MTIALPMVQQFREASRRQAAAEDLKSVALALQNYEAAKQSGQRTVDVVRELVSTQLGVEAKEITERTSLAELGADDLDLVELVMELEEHFSISIPEESITSLDGKALGQSQFEALTMLRIAEIVDQRRN
jgi:acyl carrier protein